MDALDLVVQVAPCNRRLDRIAGGKQEFLSEHCSQRFSGLICETDADNLRYSRAKQGGADSRASPKEVDERVDLFIRKFSTSFRVIDSRGSSGPGSTWSARCVDPRSDKDDEPGFLADRQTEVAEDSTRHHPYRLLDVQLHASQSELWS